MRNALAVLEHNSNVDRPIRKTELGTDYIKAQVSKRRKEWVAYTEHVPKNFDYVYGEFLPFNNTLYEIHYPIYFEKL